MPSFASTPGPRPPTRETVYTRLSNPGRGPFSSAGDKRVLREKIAEGPLGCLANADARRGLNASGQKAIFSDPESGIRRSQIASVIAGACDTEGFRETPGAACKFGESAGVFEGDAAVASHFGDAEQGLESAEEDGSGFPLALTRYVQTIMIAVDEIDIGITGGTEENGVAGSISGCGVRRRVVLTKVSFYLNDASCQTKLIGVANQHFSEKFAGHAARITGEEDAVERANGNERCGRRHQSECRSHIAKVKMQKAECKSNGWFCGGIEVGMQSRATIGSAIA